MQSYKAGIPTGKKCEKCGQGELLERISRHGFFLGCSRYPDCDYSSWDRPVPLPCPQCGGMMTVLGRTQRADGPQKVKCTRCGHVTEWSGSTVEEPTYVATGA